MLPRPRHRKSESIALRRELLAQRRSRVANGLALTASSAAEAIEGIKLQIEQALAAADAALSPAATSRAALVKAQAAYWHAAEQQYPAWKTAQQAKRAHERSKSDGGASKQLIREVRCAA
jgi:hypothetical protein